MSVSALLILTVGLVLRAPSVTAGTVTDPRRLGYSIYDEGICTRAIDCKSTQFCGESRVFGGICEDNTQNGPICGREVCDSTKFCDRSVLTCRPRRTAGAACNIYGDNCQDGLLCKNGRCIQFPNLPDGAPCGKDTIDDECRGYCNRDFADSSGVGVCAPTTPLGGACNVTTACAQKRSQGNDPVICNAVIFQQGTCARASQIIKKLGAPCNAANDTCDPTRNLACRRAPKQHKHVCLQKRIDEESPCERGNPLSRCAPGLDCRVWRQGVNPDDKFSAELVLPTLCLPRVRHRAPGQPCLQERDRCTGPSTCRNVPGVARDTGSSRIARSFSSPALYCTRTLKRFTQCSPQEKFLAQCEEGYVCRGGKCQKSRGEDTVPFTHAYDNAICERLPCGPGFKCFEPEVQKRDFNRPAPSNRCREI